MAKVMLGFNRLVSKVQRRCLVFEGILCRGCDIQLILILLALAVLFEQFSASDMM